MHDKQYDRLTDSQKKAVFHKTGPLLVLAGPGSGKTRVITHRITALIESGVRPYNICAITFTNKAAEEMRQRVLALEPLPGIYISTFHSLCVRILRRYYDKAGVKSNFSIYDTAEQSNCMKQAIKDCNLDAANFPPARMLEAVSTLKNKLIDVGSFKERANDLFSKSLSMVYARYQQIMKEHNAVDFDDLLAMTAFLLENNADVAAELGDRFKYLLVDEYQDTNHAQYKIAKAVVSQHSNICVTGDPDQSIYRWRGADIANILAFEKDWPDATIVKLEENFRSTPNILELADKLILFNQKRKQKRLIPVKPPGKDVVVAVYEDEVQEAQAVADQIQQLIKQGTRLSDIAVFYRVNAMSRAVEEAFIQNRIAYQMVRGVEFYGRKEIRDMLAYLKILANPDDEIAILRIINTPARGIGKTTIDKVRDFAKLNHMTLFDALKKTALIDTLPESAKAKIAAFVNMIEKLKKDLAGPVAPLVSRIFTESGLEKSLQIPGARDDDAIDNINELISTAAKYDRQAEQPLLIDYLQQISLFSDTDIYDKSIDRVAMMTLHAAKGLEFENAFIIGLEQGLLPHERSNVGADELEEERRLFFVGITRAKSGLHISYARYRTLRGQLLRTIQSQFLFELGLSVAEHTEQERRYYKEDDDDNTYSPTAPSAVPLFTKGQLVRHKKFGIGTVKEFIDMGENSIVTIKFNAGQTKSLMLKYAELTKQ